MEQLISYILKSSLILTITFILYQLLKNDKNFTRNRIFLISGIVFSLILPLINFQASESVKIYGSVLLAPITIGVKGLSATLSQNLSFIRILIIIYLSVALVLFVLKVLQITKLLILVGKSGVLYEKGYKIVRAEENCSSFSFFKLIFLGGPISDDKDAILAHEKAHVDQRHSIDVILMEIIAIVQWFNPVVWFYRTLLREVHEFLADRTTLKNGVEKAGYIQLLLAMAVEVKPADITNNFCQIKLKRRLKMITKIRNSRFSGAKFILALPLLAIFLWAVSCTNAQKNNNDAGKDSIQQSKVSDSASKGEAYQVVDEMPVYPGGDEARAKFIGGNIKYPQTAKEKGVQGKVFVSFVIETDGSVSEVKTQQGIGSGCDEEAIRVVKMMPKWTPGKQAGKNVRVSFTMPIKFALE
jgi:TonB family protein